jgi:hypothetical protein
MNIIRSKDIIDVRPAWDSNRTIGASLRLRHATEWRTANQFSGSNFGANLRPPRPGGDIHNSSTVIKVKKIFARFSNPA